MSPKEHTPAADAAWTYEATDADLDALAAEKALASERAIEELRARLSGAHVETTAELLRRLTKERNEARAEVERVCAEAWAEVRDSDARYLQTYKAKKALAAKLARVEAVAADPDFANGHVSVVRIRAALADADATAASPSGLDVDPAAERPTPATTEDEDNRTECASCDVRGALLKWSEHHDAHFCPACYARENGVPE